MGGENCDKEELLYAEWGGAKSRIGQRQCQWAGSGLLGIVPAPLSHFTRIHVQMVLCLVQLNLLNKADVSLQRNRTRVC